MQGIQLEVTKNEENKRPKKKNAHDDTVTEKIYLNLIQPRVTRHCWLPLAATNQKSRKQVATHWFNSFILPLAVHRGAESCLVKLLDNVMIKWNRLYGAEKNNA